MANPARQDEFSLSVAEYLELEATSEIRHEYYDGQVWPVGNPDNLPHLMAGASPAHNRLVANLVARLDALEIRVAYQNETIEELNAALTRQWAEIDKLRRELVLLEAELREAAEPGAADGLPGRKLAEARGG